MPTSDRTEPPTGRRIAEARKEGQVARSQELSAAVALLMGVWLLRGMGKNLIEGFKDILTSTMSTLTIKEFNDIMLSQTMTRYSFMLMPSLAIIILSLLVVGICINISQTGFLWITKRLGIDLNRLNPLNGLKRLFSIHGIVEFLKNLIKLFLIGWIAYSFLKGKFTTLISLSQMEFPYSLDTWVEVAFSLLTRVGLAYFVLACIDYGYQRWQYFRSLRMTKQEVKDELKQTEGDPLIRGYIRRQQRRLARLRMMANVHKADVVITNPTHLAIAIQYEPETMQAPKVLAKGAYRIAERIIQIAQAHQIPVIQNIPLAQALYKMVDIDQEIPPELYLAMAEVLAYVFKLREHKKRSEFSTSL